jgi:hypothetical protein
MGGTLNMLFKKTDLWSALMSLISAKFCRAAAGLSIPVMQHAHLLQAGGGSALVLPACLGCFLTESIKDCINKFSQTEDNREKTSAESDELRATYFVGVSNDDTR